MKKRQTSFVNVEQKKLYLVQIAFRTAKITAIVVVFLMLFSRI